MERDLARFKALIKQRCGLLFEGHSEANLARTLAARSRELNMPAATYYAEAHGNRAEFQELINRLTINETYFFREAEHIRLLVDHLVPRLLAERDSGAPLRILSAGCASGEEPYSLVMALMDKYGECVAQQFEFVGGDIDSAVLAKARHARYTDFSFRGVSNAVRDRYFDADGWGFLIKEQVRRQVQFHEFNLLDGAMSPALRDFDIVLFRNVSIYFDAATRKVVQQNITALMKDKAVLITGTAETLANDLGVLQLVEEAGLYYFAKGQPSIPQVRVSAQAIRTPVAATLPMAPGSRSRGDFTSTPPAAADPRSAAPVPVPVALDAIGQLLRDRRYDQALPLLDEVLHLDADHAHALLLKAHVLINRRDFATAERLAKSVQARNVWSIDALLLLGLAAKWQRQPQAAIHWFKQAAYAHQTCWVAHYYLADLYREGDETERACRAYRVVLQLLGGDATDTGIEVVPLDLPVGEIRFLCTHQLGKLSAAKTPEGQR